MKALKAPLEQNPFLDHLTHVLKYRKESVKLAHWTGLTTTGGSVGASSQQEYGQFF
jgi:hypothetical protein